MAVTGPKADEQARERRSYERPRIIAYGSLTDLALGNPSATPDNGVNASGYTVPG